MSERKVFRVTFLKKFVIRLKMIHISCIHILLRKFKKNVNGANNWKLKGPSFKKKKRTYAGPKTKLEMAYLVQTHSLKDGMCKFA